MAEIKKNTNNNSDNTRDESEIESVVPGSIKNLGKYSTEIKSQMRKQRTKKKTEDEAMAFLHKARSLGWILCGTLLSVEEFDNENINETSELAVRVQFEHEDYKTNEHWGRVNVLIPESLFYEKGIIFASGYDFMSDEQKKRVRRSFLAGYIGAWIHFNVVAVYKNHDRNDDNDEFAKCVGNRLSAMQRMRDKYFFHADERYARDFVDVEEGRIVEAFVQRVSDDSIVVSSLGVETKVVRYELSQHYISKCSDLVKNGDVLQLRVRVATVENGKVFLNLTNRKTVLASSLDWLKPGVTIGGEVILPKNDKGYYSVMLDNDVFCAVAETNVIGYLPMLPGDRVIIEVLDVHERIVYGRAKRGF